MACDGQGDLGGSRRGFDHDRRRTEQAAIEKEDVEALLKRLDLHEEEEEYVWDTEVDVQAKWLAIARVHTSKGFSPSTLYSDMRSG